MKFLSWQGLGVEGNDSYLFFESLTGPRVILMIVNVNKMVEKGAKRVKGYLRLRGVVQLKQFRSTGLLSLLLGGSLGGFLGFPGPFCSFMVIFFLPKVVISL